MTRDPLIELRILHRQIRSRALKARRDAEILLAQASALEVAEIDLDLAIDRAAKQLASDSDGSPKGGDRATGLHPKDDSAVHEVESPK